MALRISVFCKAVRVKSLKWYTLSLSFCTAYLSDHEYLCKGIEYPGLDSLCSLILYEHVTVVEGVNDFLLKVGKVDDEDEHGRTALMMACRLGNKDIVQFLLNEGADPQKQCKDLSTPLHFACRPKPSKVDEAKQLPIIEMLVKHGAKMTPDIHGLTPICYAALYKMSGIVERGYHLGNSKEDFSMSDRILAYEILAFELSVFDDDHSQAYQAILRCLILREESGDPVVPSVDQADLETCLGTHACKTPGELYEKGAREEDMHNLKKQGFLIGARVLPDVVKIISLWPLLASIHNHDSTESHLHTCGLILRLESQSKLAIGTALEGMTDLLDPVGVPSATRLMPSEYNLYHSNLKSFKEILPKADIRHVLKEASGIHHDLIMVLTGVIGNLSGDEMCPAIIRTITDLVGVLYKCTDYRIRVPSVLWALVDFYNSIERDGGRLGSRNPNYEIEKKYVMNMLQLACILLVKHEYPTLKRPHEERRKTGEENGDNEEALTESGARARGAGEEWGREGLLFYVLECLFFEIDFWLAVTTPVVRQFLRFGCPAEPVLDKALTCRRLLVDVAEYPPMINLTYNPECLQNCEELVDLLKKEKEAVQPLQELVIRVVLKNRIQYHGIVPRPICDIIDGVSGI